MGICKEIPPTAGLPIHGKDFLSIFPKQNFQGSLEEDFKNYLGVPYAKVLCSGTAAFYIILESLKELSAKKTVIIPSFICPLVPLAISRAGLKIAICDIHKDNFNFQMRQLEELCAQNRDILAIVAVHLAGIPVDLESIKQIAQKNKIFVVEDCAQSLGAQYQGRKVGTEAEFSFFSLCRGKGLTIYEGGVIVTNKEEYAAIIDRRIKLLVKDAFFSESLKIWELLGYWIFYRPRLFWFVYRLPQIFWNWRGQTLRALTEYFTIDFPLLKVSGLRKAIGHVNFSRADKEINQQRQKAASYIEGLKDTAGIRLITEAARTKATYPYVTLFFDAPDKKKKALQILQNTGLGVSRIYASPITGYGYLKQVVPQKDSPAARYLAERHLTLSTSTYLSKKDMDSIIGILNKL